MCGESRKHGSEGGGRKRTQPVARHCRRITGPRTRQKTHLAGRLPYILAAVAEDEARRISERTKAALAAYKARGGKLGKPENLTPEAGRRGAAATSAQARTAYAALLPELRQWRAAGLSYREIAAMLNGGGRTTRTGALWNHNQVKRVLSRVEG